MKLRSNRITLETDFEKIKSSQESKHFVIQSFSSFEIVGLLDILDPKETYLCRLELLNRSNNRRIDFSIPFLLNSEINPKLLSDFIFNNDEVRFARSFEEKTCVIIRYSKITGYKF